MSIMLLECKIVSLNIVDIIYKPLGDASKISGRKRLYSSMSTPPPGVQSQLPL